MGNVLTFAPRPSAALPVEPAPMGEAEIRTRLGEALQTALDAADHIIAVLDRMDGDIDAEDGGDAEPALAAPENTHGSQVVWLRNNDSGREAEALETVLPVVAAEWAVIPLAPLPWRGSGNVVAAAGVALLEMVAGR
ncbi:hypothetical protein FV222_23135 [Methylobacterium sp. WL103]|uniref:hypothetical protein n=1 Tax=Methylobacterium sp. WL103 TaxID=2603891 RepID=UPI0011C7EFE8|nr:hypothetical protein [Methylobacterium sp. WL103]TXM92673.1 hypothetical protein FV222_23135 [Methylobacterium sp. WL103]